MTSQTINLNLIPGSIEPVINVSQYDKGQTWNFNIYSGSQPFTIPTGSSITIQGTKPDKTGFQYGCTFSGNVVTAIEQQQMTILSGKVPAEIVITKDDELIGSLNFNIMVEKAALADDTAISETDLPLIEEAVEALSHIDETLETMKGYKEDSEAYAIGKRNGSDVGSSDPAYHNNSRYYAGQASSSASSASGSATSAGTNALISEGYAVGKQNGSAVGSGSPYYQNNAEYYKGQAANSATNAGNSATAASGSATTASNKALVAEGYADGKQNGTDVASGSPYYHNNSKYYSEQAAASAQSAAQSAASFTVDSTLSTSSTNPVQNKVITTDLNNVKQALTNLTNYVTDTGVKNLVPLTYDNVLIALKNCDVTNITYSSNKIDFTYSSVDFTFYFKDGLLTKIDVDGTTPNYTVYLYVYTVNGINQNIFGDTALYSKENPTANGYTISDGTNDTNVQFMYSNNLNSSYTCCAIRLRASSTINTSVYPMIRESVITDATYQPYSKPNIELTVDTKGLTENEFANGCVNLLENKGSSVVSEGITFTVNADKSISAYGTLGANKNTVFVINANEEYRDFIGKRLKLSGCPKNTGLPSCRITAYRVESADGSSGSVFDYGDGVVYEHLNNGTGIRVHYQIEIGNNTSSPISINTTFKPMITLADVPNSDYAHYVPYAKSNKELTEKLKDKEITITSSNANVSITNGKLIRKGNSLVLSIEKITLPALTANSYTKIMTVTDSEMIPSQPVYALVKILNNTSSDLLVRVGADGSVTLFANGAISAVTDDYCKVVGIVGLI